jgi:outer membrane biosynthesis protein TonB
MFKRILFTGALFAAGAASAQEVAISGKDFLSGAGDAKIAELARQAAASGKTLVITAPPYWQDKAAAKAHSAAANASVRTSDAFFENVMVRVEDSKAAKAAAVEPAPKPAPVAKPDVKPEAKPEPKPEPRPAPPVRKPVEEAPAPAPKPAPVEAPPPPPPVEVKPEPPVAAPAPAPAPAPVAAPPAAAPPAAAAAKPAADPSAAIKKRYEQNLNGGQAAEGTLEVAQLQKDDIIYESGSVRAVVRRFGPRTQLFWLNGDLNMERAELVPTGTDRYRVSEPIRNVANPSLRGGGKATSLKFVANVPAPKSPARTTMEKQYNDGRDISGTLQASDLHASDLIYTAEGAAVVIRRTSVGMERYWLTGEIDLHQTGLQQTGNAIRVLTDNVK